ncbi:MAG TPA: phosphate ABC transporter substrate-binding protein [Candidatus Wallbacteria bacterium]|nr:phosphate ABC transporter substrate-binding protein [Candidatus Wallbacteria bacterium]
MKWFSLKGYVTFPAVFSLLFLLVQFFGCGGAPAESSSQKFQNNRIMIAGSTSIQPIAEKLAEHYAKSHPQVKIEVQGGGSSAGIQAARSGVAGIGTSSRELKEGEKDLFTTILAYDAIVLIVNPANPLNDISIADAARLFSSASPDWKDFSGGNASAPVTVITREEGSGTRGAFEELVMRTSEISARCLVQDSTGALREIVADDSNAIGYVSFGAINGRVKPLSVGGIKPVMENMTASDSARRYKIIRPFLFVTKKKPDGACLEFIKYIKSEEGAKLLIQEGLIPANEK